MTFLVNYLNNIQPLSLNSAILISKSSTVQFKKSARQSRQKYLSIFLPSSFLFNAIWSFFGLLPHKLQTTFFKTFSPLDFLLLLYPGLFCLETLYQ